MSTTTDTTPEASATTDSDPEFEEGDFDVGELKNLFGALHDESALERALSDSLSLITSGAIQGECYQQSSKTLSVESAYGHPLSTEEAEKRLPPGNGGIQWHSLLINADSPFNADGTLRRGLTPRDYDMEKKTIKPRRASLPIVAKDFYSSLTRIGGPKGQARFIFHGILNGWPSLRTFEVVRIERKREKEFVRPSQIIAGQRVWGR